MYIYVYIYIYIYIYIKFLLCLLRKLTHIVILIKEHISGNAVSCEGFLFKRENTSPWDVGKH